VRSQFALRILFGLALGVMLAASGAPEAGAREAALASLALSPQEAQPAELKARIATYAALASAADKKNLPFLRTALRLDANGYLTTVTNPASEAVALTYSSDH